MANSLSKSRQYIQVLMLLSTLLLVRENAFSQACPNLGNLTKYLFVFTNGSTDANWQGATKGFNGDVAVDGIQAAERTSGGVPFAGTIYTNDATLGAWASIVSQNPGQAFASLNQGPRIAGLEADLANAFSQINALSPSPGFSSISASSLNGLNKQNGIAEVIVINITSGLAVSSQINITGDANDCFILRWDSDGNPNNGYQGQTKFQSGGAIVPKGGLKPSNFINVAGDINSSGGGGNPPAPYPQGPRYNDGLGGLATGTTNWGGGGFFTGYWLTTGDPATGQSSSLSNGIFVGGWYTSANKFSLTSGTSGVYVSPPTFMQLGSIGDCVWNDLNQNGTKDAGEPGVPNVTVQLRNCSDVVLQTMQTNASGIYTFSNLAAGCYRVCAVLPSGFQFSPQNVGSDATDSDVSPTNGCTANVNLAAGQNDPTNDIGIFQPTVQTGSLGDCVWNDLNQNGTKDAGEPGVPDVTVQLRNCSDVVLQTMQTNASGIYTFSNLAAGCYRVCAVLPSGFQFSPQNVGSDATDSDVSPANGCTANVNLAAGQNDPTNDIGIFQPTQPCNINIVITNKICDGKNTATTADDTYSFTMTVTGTGTGSTWQGSYDNAYLGVFQFGPTAYNTPINLGPFPAGQFTPGNVFPPPTLTNGVDIHIAVSDSQNSNCTASQTVPSTGPCSPSTNPCDNVSITATAGTITVTGLGGSPIAMVQVFNAAWTQIFNCAGNCTVPTQVIPGLPAGTYFVKVSLLNAAWSAVCQKEIYVTVPPPGTTGSVGDFVWNDGNQNGVQDAGEPGVSGVRVHLFTCAGVQLQEKFTSGLGIYNFPNVAAGSYYVTFDLLPAGFVFSAKDAGGNDATDSDAAPADGKTDCFTLAPGENKTTVDAGIRPSSAGPASLGDFVWHDINNNGLQDVGEMGIPDVWVGLYDNAGNFLQETITDANGLYLFQNLTPGTYKVKIPPPTGLKNSPRNTGTNEAKDSDLDDVTFTNFSDAVTLAAGQNYRDLDAGFSSIPSPCTKPLTATVSGATCAGGQVTFSLLVTGGNPWGWNINNGGQFIMGTYGIAKTVTLPMPGSSLSVIISDSDNPTCVTNATLTCSAPPANGADLELTSNASPLNPGQWANSVLTFSLKNNGTVAATGVEVRLPAASDAAFSAVLAFVAQNVPAGTSFNSWTGVWTVGNVAPGQTLNLGYTLFTKSGGAIPVFAQVTAQSPADVDSSPNNNSTGTPAEDDEARTTLNPPGGLLLPGDRKEAVVPDLSKIADFTLFPNPAGETVTIDLQTWQGKAVNILILNQFGKVVFQKQLDRLGEPLLTLDLSKFLNGQYFVQLDAAGQRSVVRKLAVTRTY